MTCLTGARIHVFNAILGERLSGEECDVENVSALLGV